MVWYKKLYYTYKSNGKEQYMLRKLEHQLKFTVALHKANEQYKFISSNLTTKH